MNQIIQPQNWPSFMSIIEAKYYDDKGNCLYEDHNLPNIWHTEGQQFMLSLAFDTSAGFSVPTNYYLGLDNRATLDVDDTLAILEDEPSSNGYARQAVNSSTGFNIGFDNGKLKAVTGVCTFVATGGAWGPVKNLFLATTIDNSGILIASVPLSTTQTTTSGNSFTVRVGLALSR